MNGYSIEVPSSSLAADADATQTMHILTGNDLPMLDPKCLLVDDHKICWEKEPVAKPFDFVNNRCRINQEDDQLHCLGPTTTN